MRSLKHHGFANVEFNKYARAFGVALIGALGSFQVMALSGGVTTFANSPTTTGTVVRTAIGPAMTPERDATYQRTMRTAQSAAAASRAAGKVIKALGVIGVALTAVELAVELNGIWSKNGAGENVLTAQDPAVCSVGPCFKYKHTFNPSFYASASSACQGLVSHFNSVDPDYLYGVSSNTETQCNYSYVKKVNPVSGPAFGGQPLQKVAVQTEPPASKVFSDAEIEAELQKVDRLPKLLDDLKKQGIEIPWPEPEIQDMPSPITIQPRVTTLPDGSKITERVTLTPYRAPDGKTINWERTTSTTTTSPPAADGSTTTGPATTVTENSGPSDAPPAEDVPECKKSPNTLGCIEMDMPTGEIPKSNKDVSYVAETLFGSGSCPPDKSIVQSLTGRNIVLSYSTTCNSLANYVRPLIIAIALMMAYMIILPGNRE